MASDTAVVAVQPGRPAPWRDPRLRGIALQVVFVAVIAGIIGFLAYNTTVNLRRQLAPAPRQAWQPLPGVFVSNRGILLPVPREDPAYWWMAAAFAIALAIGYAVFRWARRRQAETGRQFPAGWVGFGLAIGLP